MMSNTILLQLQSSIFLPGFCCRESGSFPLYLGKLLRNFIRSEILYLGGGPPEPGGSEL